jgi:hypothetical protein
MKTVEEPLERSRGFLRRLVLLLLVRVVELGVVGKE